MIKDYWVRRNWNLTTRMEKNWDRKNQRDSNKQKNLHSKKKYLKRLENHSGSTRSLSECNFFWRNSCIKRCFIRTLEISFRFRWWKRFREFIWKREANYPMVPWIWDNFRTSGKGWFKLCILFQAWRISRFNFSSCCRSRKCLTNMGGN